MSFYDINGNEVANSALNNFIDNMDFDYEYDATSNANYTVMRIYKTKIDGTKQYPFVFAPNGAGRGTQSTLDMMLTHPQWIFGMNAGIFVSAGADGIVIQNGISVVNSPSTLHVGAYPLTIDGNGNLSYASPDADTADLIANGVVSAVCGFCPLIVDYVPVEASMYNWISHWNENAQRQIIGQWGNGDYAIVTSEGRGHQHSDGWKLEEAIVILQKLGVKFAYNLDGGGSTESVLGKKHINDIYDNTTGRVVPTFICFNGTTSFTAET